MAAPDAVINAAWYAEPRLYLHDVERNIKSLQTSLAVLRTALAAGVSGVVLVGTCLEGVEFSPESIYARTKRCLHDLALTPALQSRAVVTCAHIFSPYGPYEHPDRVVPAIIRALLQDKPIAVGPGTSRRDYVHVADVATALSVLVEGSLGGEVDVCTGQSRLLQDLFTAIADELDRPDLIKWCQAEIQPGEAFDAEGDPRMLHGLGWRPKFDLESGIRDSIAWWRRQTEIKKGPH